MESKTLVADRVVAQALAFAGAHIVEIQPNQGWEPNKSFPNFTKDMISVGWYKGGEWCAFSGILVWKNAYSIKADIWNYVRKLLSGNSQDTLRNCRADKFWPTGDVPKPGAIVIWQDGNSQTQGHFGICVSVNGNSFVTAEGNTSDPGSPSIRLGWTYALHTHTVGAPHSSTGLNYLRSIYVVEQDQWDKFNTPIKKG